MAQLRQDYHQFQQRDTEVVVIGPEDADTFQRTWSKEGLPFVGIPDPNHAVADLYGQQVNWLKLGRMPAVVVVDKQGQIRYRHYGKSMRDIPDNQQLLALLDTLNSEGTDD